MRLICIAVASFGLLASSAAGLSLPRQELGYELPRAEVATGLTVLCLSDHQIARYARLMHDPAIRVGSFWMPDLKIVVLSKTTFCNDLAHWRHDWDTNVSVAIATLGHEAAHARQQQLGLPFDERQADCWSEYGFYRLKRKLGIWRKGVTPPDYPGC